MSRSRWTSRISGKSTAASAWSRWHSVSSLNTRRTWCTERDISRPTQLEYIGGAVLAITGHTPAEFYATPNLAAKCVHPEDRDRMVTTENLPHVPSVAILRWIHPNGRVVHAEHRRVTIYEQYRSNPGCRGDRPRRHRVCRSAATFARIRRAAATAGGAPARRARGGARSGRARVARRARADTHRPETRHHPYGASLDARALDAAHRRPIAIVDWTERHRSRDGQADRDEVASANAGSSGSGRSDSLGSGHVQSAHGAALQRPHEQGTDCSQLRATDGRSFASSRKP